MKHTSDIINSTEFKVWLRDYIEVMEYEVEENEEGSYHDAEELHKRKIRTSPVNTINPMTAEEANKLKQKSVTQVQVDALLKPVFDKVAKASEKGDSEIFLGGRDWYYNNNEKYKLATQQLTKLGYGVWKDNDGFGVRVKW